MQALVTGAAKRLGRTIALTLQGAGYRVAVHYRSSRADAEQTAALLGGAPLIQGDQAKDPERIVHEAARALGGLDLLVCSAARFEKAPADQLPREQFEAMLASNLTGPFYLMQAALPHLRARRGSIVTLLDVCGTAQVWKGYAHYAASKAGLAALTRQLALEWAVVPIVIEGATSTEDLWRRTVDAIRASGLAAAGERVVLSGGTRLNRPGTTDHVVVRTIE